MRLCASWWRAVMCGRLMGAGVVAPRVRRLARSEGGRPEAAFWRGLLSFDVVILKADHL